MQRFHGPAVGESFTTVPASEDHVQGRALLFATCVSFGMSRGERAFDGRELLSAAIPETSGYAFGFDRIRFFLFISSGWQSEEFLPKIEFSFAPSSRCVCVGVCACLNSKPHASSGHVKICRRSALNLMSNCRPAAVNSTAAFGFGLGCTRSFPVCFDSVFVVVTQLALPFTTITLTFVRLSPCDDVAASSSDCT